MSAKFLYIDDITGVITEASAAPLVTTNTFGTASAVPAGSETLISSYTVPALKTFYLERVHYSGENVALFKVYIDATLIGTARTMFGGELTGEINFTGSLTIGQAVPAGSVISVKALHNRPSSADFESTIIGGLSG